MTEPNHMIPLSAMRAIAVEAIRAVTGCPDVEGNGRYLVDELEDVALAAWRAFQAEPAAQQAPKGGEREALKHFAAFPLEEFNMQAKPDDKVITGFNDWILQVGHIRKARAALAQYPKAGDEQERKDAERLDWLEGQKCVALTLLRISAKPDATRYWCIEDWDGDDVTDGVEPEDRQTLRAAIDAAMLAKEPAIPSPAAAHRTE